MTYKFSKVVIGLVAVLAFSGQASADGITGTQAGSGGTVTSSGLSAGSFNSYGLNGYTDIYAISTSSLSDFTATATPESSIQRKILGTLHTVTTYTGTLTETLYDSSGKQVGSSFVSTIGNADKATFNNLAKGSYTLKITTTDSGPNGKYTAYGLTSTVTPVPEPTEGALMLSGIGLLGFIASRRKKSA